MSSLKPLIACGVLLSITARATTQQPEKKVPSAEDIRKMMGPQTIDCTSENRMIVGNRFLEMDYASKEKKAECQFSLGFDRRHQHYTLTAMDSFGTYPVHSQGKREGDSGKAKLYGKDDDPMMKAMGFTKEFVHVVDFKSPDDFVIEVWFIDTRTAERKEIKAMEYTFKRKK